MEKTRSDSGRTDAPSALSGDDAAIVARLRERSGGSARRWPR